MDLYEAIRKRHSIRSFDPKEIEDEKLTRILDTARMSPSAKNEQERKIIVVRDEQTRKALAHASAQRFVGEAPIVLAIVSTKPSYTMMCEVDAAPVDCAIAVDHITLAAVAEGLGTCWIGHFDQAECCRLLHIPASAKIMALLPVGYPKGRAVRTDRKDLKEIVSSDRFS